MTELTSTVSACPQCYRTFPDEVRFCGLCGVPLVLRTLTEPLAQPQPNEESAYLGSLIDGRYRINRLIGRGGMGSVYEVEHVHMRKILAMKLLHEDMVVRKQLVGRFTREARAVSRLNNEHTVRVYDFGRHEALFFLVMEYLDGEDLEMLLSREGALPWRRGLEILDQVCDSLAEAHDAGIVHRDLKPENIMLLDRPGAPDYAKVLDFGLAKVTNVDDVFSVHSHRDLFGTPYYMSPEQIRSGDIDRRADVYALGCLAYRVLTNQHVYNAPYAFDVLRQHLTAPVPSVCRTIPEANIPPRVDRFVWRALQKRPENRFPNTIAMRREIADCLAHPDGDSLVIGSLPISPEPTPIIDAALERRLQAFEQSHQEAEARMHGDIPPPLPDDGQRPLAVGIAVDVPSLVDTQMPEPPADEYETDAACEHEDEDEDEDTREEAGEHDDMGATLEMAAPWLRDSAVAGIQMPDLELSREQPLISPEPGEPEPGEPEPLAEDEDYQHAALEAEPDLAHGDELDRLRFEEADEELGYARRLRRQRRWRTGLGVLVGGICVAVALVLWTRHKPAVQSARELEPNDSAPQANVLKPGEPIRGFIGKRLATFDSDRDHYRLSMGGGGRYLELRLSAIPNLDLYVDVLDGDGRQLAHINKDGLGQPETLHRFRVPTTEVVLKVSEHKVGDGRPTENVSDPYELTATIKEAPKREGEVEPNDTPLSANPYRPGKSFVGYLDGVKDVDYFQISMDGQMDLRRWELALKMEGESSLVPRVNLYRLVGSEPMLVFADEGGQGRLVTVYEEPNFPNFEYLLAVSHSGRGDRRGAYKLVADVLPKKQRIAHENDDDRARATPIAIGEEIHGVIDGPRDVDMFVIPITDPEHREIQVLIDGVVRDRLRISLTDINSANVRQFPPPHAPGKRRAPQPIEGDRSEIRFKGDGEKYYVAISPQTRNDHNAGYSFRVYRVMDSEQRPRVGGPGY